VNLTQPVFGHDQVYGELTRELNREKCLY